MGWWNRRVAKFGIVNVQCRRVEDVVFLQCWVAIIIFNVPISLPFGIPRNTQGSNNILKNIFIPNWCEY